MSILLDTGFLFARLHTRDRNHEAARALEAELLDGVHGRVMTTTSVGDELMTLIQARGGQASDVRAAADLLGLAGQGPPLATILDADPSHVVATGRLFDRHVDQGLGSTDRSHLVTMERWSIDRLATFDRGFEGLVEVLPATGAAPRCPGADRRRTAVGWDRDEARHPQAPHPPTGDARTAPTERARRCPWALADDTGVWPELTPRWVPPASSACSSPRAWMPA